jgi:hypothetical protein
LVGPTSGKPSTHGLGVYVELPCKVIFGELRIVERAA